VSSKYHPAQIDEVEDRRSLISEPVPSPNVVALPKARSLHAVIAQSLQDIEGLIARLEAGVRVADSQRLVIRDLYVQCRKQREILEAALRLELE
jgi:hypothetical protein